MAFVEVRLKLHTPFFGMVPVSATYSPSEVETPQMGV